MLWRDTTFVVLFQTFATSLMICMIYRHKLIITKNVDKVWRQFLAKTRSWWWTVFCDLSTTPLRRSCRKFMHIGWKMAKLSRGEALQIENDVTARNGQDLYKFWYFFRIRRQNYLRGPFVPKGLWTAARISPNPWNGRDIAPQSFKATCHSCVCTYIHMYVCKLADEGPCRRRLVSATLGSIKILQ